MLIVSIKKHSIMLVYTAGISEAVREPSVEALLLVYVIPNVNVAYMDGPYTLQRAEYLLEDYTVLVYAVGNEQAGKSARRMPGRPQKGDGIMLFKFYTLFKIIGIDSLTCHPSLREEPNMRIHNSGEP